MAGLRCAAGQLLQEAELKTINELSSAAEEGLASLLQRPDIVDVEVFVAENKSCIARLNFTSKLPCNGIEEPKSNESYGLSIRAAFKTGEGVKVGFGSESSDISDIGLARALKKAEDNAVYDPGFVAFAKATGEKRTMYNYHDKRLMDLNNRSFVGLGELALDGGLHIFNEEYKQLRHKNLIMSGDITVLLEKIAIASTSLRAVQTDESTLLMGFITSMVEDSVDSSGDSKGSGYLTGSSSDDFPQCTHAGMHSAENAVKGVNAGRIKPGEYTVIFDRAAVFELFNNLVIGSLTTEAFYASLSSFLGKFGKQITNENLTIYDNGAAPGLTGSKGITCEGLPTGRTELIREGVLCGLLSDSYQTNRLLLETNAKKMKENLGVDPSAYKNAFTPRNGFRFSSGGGRHIYTPPSTAPTNVIIEGKEKTSFEQMLHGIENGLFIGRMWYVYPINGHISGDFTGTVIADSYIIQNGRIAAPLQPNTVRINDNILNVLNNIVGITETSNQSTLCWAADGMIYAPRIAVKSVRIDNVK